jgi:hypothetical protein
MKKENRINTEELFKGIIGADAEKAVEKSMPVKKEGSKKENEKKLQVSIYLTEEQIIALDEQTGIKKKERDKSALVRIGVDIVTAMDDEEYKRLKTAAVEKEKTEGYIIKEALQTYFSKESRE